VTPGDLPSEAQLAAIYREFSGQIHTYAYHLLGNPEDADDITQEVFIRAYARLGQLRAQASMRSWLYRIATNLCMDHLRRRSRVKRIFGLEAPLGGSGAGPDDPPQRDIAQPMAAAEIDSVAERDHIALALKRMPDKYAVCLLLHSLQGLSYREIADVVGVSPGAAAVRLSRARDLFARYYEELRREGAR
jgi:RNA polymerase sigma-70 factor (ECF subfamily)